MRPPALAVTLGLVLTLALVGCGASSLSAIQLRTRAERICAVAQRRTAMLPTPTLPSQESRYLRAGIAAFTPQLNALRALHAPGDLARGYRIALANDSATIRALHATLAGLHAGNDPVVAIKTLQQQLRPLESRANNAWESVGISGCQTR